MHASTTVGERTRLCSSQIRKAALEKKIQNEPKITTILTSLLWPLSLMFLSAFFVPCQTYIFMFKPKLLNKLEIFVLLIYFSLINQVRICELLHETNDLKEKKNLKRYDNT